MKNRKLFLVFEAAFCGVWTALLMICLTGTQHNIVWYKETFVTIVIFFSLLGMIYCLKLAEPWLIKYERIILPVFFSLWAVFLYLVSCIARCDLTHDYLSVYDAAVNYASGMDMDWTYLARWGNNFPVFLVIAFIARCSRLLGMADPFYLLLLVNVAVVMWTGGCVYVLADKLQSKAWVRMAGLLLFAAFIPCWGGTHIFYSDSFSLCFGAWGACLMLDERKGLQAGFAAGAVWAVGYYMKATSAIAMIAVLLLLLLTEKWKQCGKQIGMVFAGFLIIVIGYQTLYSQFPCYAMEEYRAPVTYWLALGLSGNGSYGENEAFAMQCLGTAGFMEKDAVAREYIMENRREIWNISHIISKIRYNFASGNLGLSANNNDPKNILFSFFNDYGKYGGYMTMVTSGYLYALLVMGICGSIAAFRNLLRGRMEPVLFYVIQLSLCGIFMFLMLWEANNRQLYNQMSWLALLGVSGCVQLFKNRKCWN